MAAGELRALDPSNGRRAGGRTLALSLIIFVVAMAGLAVSPVVLESVYPAGPDHAEIGNVGQAYGAASAMVAGLALFVVSASVFVQYRHLRAMEIQALDRFSEELVSLAMELPRYRQCWGARVSPADIPEDLFYYCSKVMRLWMRSWELGKIDEAQARDYLAKFFDSEVPRTFWMKCGELHRGGQRPDRRHRFIDLVNEEYLRAGKQPPSRPYEDAQAACERYSGANLGACAQSDPLTSGESHRP